MKYLCLMYYDEATLNALPPGEYQACVQEAHDQIEELIASGHFLGAHELQQVRTATTIRVRNGNLSATDGPFAETKEQLGGYLLIDARDLNDAIRICARFMPARLGCVEIRPVKEWPAA
jgi:hypothetical protein